MNNDYIEVIKVHHKEQDGCLRHFTNPRKELTTNIGCYFIYGLQDELLYVGKSNAGLLERAMCSAKERATGGFKRIELVEFDTNADVSIYEIYYITRLKPKLNKESSCKDAPSFELPDIGRHYSVDIISEEEWHRDSYYTSCQCLKSELYNKDKHVLYNDDNLLIIHDRFDNPDIYGLPVCGNIAGQVFEFDDVLRVFHLINENTYSQNDFSN